MEQMIHGRRSIKNLGILRRIEGYKGKISQDMESDMVFVGLQGMIDPPRQEVLATVESVKWQV